METIEPIAYVNFCLTIVSFWGVTIVYVKFIAPVTVNRKRFILFGLRTELALMAMRGEISEESKEYTILQSLIKAGLQSIDDCRLSHVLAAQVRMATDKEFRESVHEIVDFVSSTDAPEKYQYILSQALEVNFKLYKDKVWLLWHLMWAAFSMLSLAKRITVFRDVREQLRKERHKLRNTKREFEGNLNQLKAAA